MASDNFTNTDGTLLSAHNANWANRGGNSMKIINNTASRNLDAWNGNWWNVTTASAHYSKVTLHASADWEGGPAVRMQSGSTEFYYALWVGGTVYIGEFLAGNPSDWDFHEGVFAAGDVIELWIDESVTTTVHLKKNGTLVETYTGKSALTGGFSGLTSTSTGTFGADSWEGGDVVTTPPISDAPEVLRTVHSGIRFR